jgi:CBS-domain-containing membrane protein
MTLLYGLSAAPASQPRNVIFGQGLSILIAIAIGHADQWTTWFRQSLATSLSIAAMVKLGVTHPPAGSVALLFATGQYGWGNLLFIMIGNVIAILAATFINNLSDSRQFPSYWGVEDLVRIIFYPERVQEKDSASPAPAPLPSATATSTGKTTAPPSPIA